MNRIVLNVQVEAKDFREQRVIEHSVVNLIHRRIRAKVLRHRASALPPLR
jgi:hypothetical protein